MRQLLRTLTVVLAIAQILALSAAFERPAYAYADPGSGLLLIQVASSTVAGALFIVRSKLRRLFRFGKNRSDTSVAQQVPDIHSNDR